MLLALIVASDLAWPKFVGDTDRTLPRRHHQFEDDGGNCLNRWIALAAAAAILLMMGVGLLPGIIPAAAGREPMILTRDDGKNVSVMAYLPAGGVCSGVAIISPGAGGSESGYAYLGIAFSDLGYMTLVVGHQESGRSAVWDRMRGLDLRGALARLITDPVAYRGRFMDIAAARRWAQGKCASAQTILVGHSMGAATVMMTAGARNRLGLEGADSFSMYIALSPQGAGTIFPAHAWSDLRKPILTLTGTEDFELGGASWKTRTAPFRNMPPGCKWLGIIDGATHMNLAGHGFSGATEKLVIGTITEFLAAVHRGDCRATLHEHGLSIETK